MYFTSRGKIGEDLIAGIEEAERLERERRKSEEKIRVVLISHSAGGALSQYVLSRGLCTVAGLCMFAAVPGFGSYVLPSPIIFSRLKVNRRIGGLATNSGSFPHR